MTFPPRQRVRACKYYIHFTNSLLKLMSGQDFDSQNSVFVDEFGLSGEDASLARDNLVGFFAVLQKIDARLRSSKDSSEKLV